LVIHVNLCTTAHISPLSLHDALPISPPGLSHRPGAGRGDHRQAYTQGPGGSVRRRSVSLLKNGSPAFLLPRSLPPTPLTGRAARDRKSTRLNSSHDQISYAVFCLKKK